MITTGKISLGALGIETDALYQWLLLMPAYEKGLTPINDVFLSNIVVKDVKFVSRILGQKELPVKNVSIKYYYGTVQEKKHIHENMTAFKSID